MFETKPSHHGEDEEVQNLGVPRVPISSRHRRGVGKQLVVKISVAHAGTVKSFRNPTWSRRSRSR